MQLTVKDAAGLLNVSERTVHRWLDDERMPVCRINDQIRFNRAALLEWATARGIQISPGVIQQPAARDAEAAGVAEALAGGGVFFDVAGHDKEAALRAVVKLMRLPPEVDRDLLLRVLVERESMASTGVGEGIAIPHVRNPIILSLRQPVIGLCFLSAPVEFGALDGQPVHTLFTLVSPTVRVHLYLLSRLTFVLRTPAFKAALSQRASPEAIVQAARAAEASFGGQALAPGTRDGGQP
jgi:PTS system nitrogen regulatory IIA component